MTLWHGYPQHPDAHPERPWWRRVGVSLVRVDDLAVERQPSCTHTGAPAVAPWADSVIIELGDWTASTGESCADLDELLARVDAAHPLPPPPPLVAQVWFWPDTERHEMVAALHEPDPGRWPPRGAVLVYGPLSPWAPP